MFKDEVPLILSAMARRKRQRSVTPREVRTAWWLYVARRFRGKTQKEVYSRFAFQAESSLSDLERGQTAASLAQLEMAADVYALPLSLFVSPPATDLDRLARLMDGGPIEPGRLPYPAVGPSTAGSRGA